MTVTCVRQLEGKRRFLSHRWEDTIKMNVGLVANILVKTTASYIMSHSTSELTVIIIIIIVKFNLAFIFQLLYFNVGI
jgi:hypothetical protein